MMPTEFKRDSVESYCMPGLQFDRIWKNPGDDPAWGLERVGTTAIISLAIAPSRARMAICRFKSRMVNPMLWWETDERNATKAATIVLLY